MDLNEMETAMTITRESLMTLEAYARARPAIDPARMQEDLPRFVNQLRNFRQNDAFQQWFRKQVELAKVSGPKRETTISGQPN